MAKSKSWSVKGIDGETRDIARDAAQAAGMTIGAWIDHAILKAKRGELAELAVPDSDIATARAPEPAAPTEASVSPEVPVEPVAPPVPSLFPVPPPTTPMPAGATEPETETTRASIPASAPASMARSADEPGIISSQPDAFVDRDAGPVFGAGYAGPKPLAPSRPHAPVGRYAIVAIVFLALLGGGGWLFVELSSTERLRAPQTATGPQSATPDPIAAPAPSATPASPNSTTSAVPDEIRTGIELARAGDAKAQHDLGMLYLAGRYVKKDSAEAANWFERAAIQGLANAQFNLGVLYQRGEGVAQNDRLAFFWYQSAAEQGMARAQHNLATAFAEGKGISKNYAKAAEWFAKAANGGLAASQYSLAMIHERGLATGSPDLAKARTWYEKAMAQGDAQASERLAAIEQRLALSKPPQTGPASPAPSVPAASSTSDTPAAISAVGRDEIREIQSLLAQMNFNPGPADGQMGRRTTDAIRLYQQFAGLEIDGTPTTELLEDMRAVAESMSKGG